MSFFRTKKTTENPFIQVDKYHIDEDRSISWTSKAILTYILGKPDGWTIQRKDLEKRSSDGRTVVETALLDLMAAGYMNWYQEIEENGQFGDWVYEVYERPEFNPNREESTAEGKRRIQERKDRNKKKNAKKKTEKPKADNPHPEQKPEKSTFSPNADNPNSDNPTSDNPPFSNTNSSNNDFSNNNLKEEEEEGASTLREFLLSENITKENAIKFENTLLKLNVTGYTNDDVLDAIEYARKAEIKRANSDNPIGELFIYAAGRLKRMMDNAALPKMKEDKPSRSNNKRQEKETEWLADDKKQKKEAEAAAVEANKDFDVEEERKKLLKELGIDPK